MCGCGHRLRWELVVSVWAWGYAQVLRMGYTDVVAACWPCLRGTRSRCQAFNSTCCLQSRVAFRMRKTRALAIPAGVRRAYT